MKAHGEKNDCPEGDGSAEIPSVDTALELLAKVRDSQDKDAFGTVLRIYKFVKKIETEDHLLSMSIICEAYRIGTIIFK